jgi:hypothetical protein
VQPSLAVGVIAFPIPLRTVNEVTTTNVEWLTTRETTESPGSRPLAARRACGLTGTIEHPTAEPGHLCIYTGVEQIEDIFKPGAEAGPEGTVDPDAETRCPSDVARHGVVEQELSDTALGGTGAEVTYEVVHVPNGECEEEREQLPSIRASGTWAVTAG